jgi:virginiamycin B lyase
MFVRRSLAMLPLLALCLVAAALGAGSAGAATPGEVSTLPVKSLCFGGGIAAAPKEGVLVRRCEGTGAGRRTSLENVLPDGEVVKLAAVESEEGLIVTGPAGEIWAAANFAGSPGKPAGIDRIASDGSVATYSIPARQSGRQMRVRGLAIGAEGALWASVGEWTQFGPIFNIETSYGGELVRIAPDGNETAFPVPDQIEPRGIALGSDGNLWFTGVRGMSAAEHHYVPGVSYVSRITPAGSFTSFRRPTADTDPEEIALGPDGDLWFNEAGPAQIGTIGVGGKFGRHYALRPPASASGLVFDQEGDAWMATYGGDLRLTPAGQETVYPRSGEAEAVAVGPEGDIWSPAGEAVQRIVPGGPGIDVSKVEADRRDGTIAVHLACGGAVSACHGTLALSMPNFDREKEHRRLGQHKLPPFPLAQTTYSVIGETQATLTIPAPAKAFSIASRYPTYFRGRGPRLTVRATVEGGPTLRRQIEVPSFVPNRSATDRPDQES